MSLSCFFFFFFLMKVRIVHTHMYISMYLEALFLNCLLAVPLVPNFYLVKFGMLNILKSSEKMYIKFCWKILKSSPWGKISFSWGPLYLQERCLHSGNAKISSICHWYFESEIFIFIFWRKKTTVRNISDKTSYFWHILVLLKGLSAPFNELKRQRYCQD